MKKLIPTLTLLVISQFTFSQNNTIAIFKFEEAEQAFENKDYKLTISKLDETEKLLGSTNPKILYLKISAQYKLIEEHPFDDFKLIESAKKLSAKYLKEFERLSGNEDKYRKIYFISEQLKDFPNTYQEFEILKKEEEEKLRRKEIEAENVRLKKIETENIILKKIEDEKIRIQEEKRLAELRDVSFGAFRFGFAKATDDDATRLSPYSSNPNSSFSTQFETGQFGLKSGFCAGLTGINAIEAINKNISPRIGFGLYMDFNLTLLKYSWESLSTTSGSASFLYTEAKYSPFVVVSVGLGPSFSIRPIGDHLFIDFYAHPDFYITAGGAYKVNTTYKGINYYIETGRYDNSLGIGRALGINIRYKKLFFGLNWRNGIVDKVSFLELYRITDNSGTYADSYSIHTPGLNLSNRSVTFGVVF